MYCPVCFNDTLGLSRSGVVHLIINGKQMDAGRFLFNLDDSRREDIYKDFTKKIEDFFKWYGGFGNKEPITNVFICSSDFRCDHSCKIPLSNKFSIVGNLLERRDVMKTLGEMAEKYDLKIELQDGVS
ncbi:MAG: hypothetical protein KC493_15915 [Bacteriovoracaceae bacterium]|nr:hypothetical protein [Bacteriovoracaceae bacterium]